MLNRNIHSSVCRTMRQAFFLSLALPLLSLIIHYLSRFVAFFLFSLLQFLPVSCIITCTWPVSQTVKTLRSQRREYGFESHTGHQSESASIRKDRGAFCMTWRLKRHQGTWGDAHEGVSALFRETHTAQVPCKGSCRRPWRASSAVSRGGAAWSQGGRWLPGYRDFLTAKKHPSGSTRRGVRRPQTAALSPDNGCRREERPRA